MSQPPDLGIRVSDGPMVDERVGPDQPIPDFMIYYDGGRTLDPDGFSRALADPTQTPARGVQVIVQKHPGVGLELVTGADYYVRQGDRWCGVDIFGLFDHLLDSGLVLFGRTISREEYSNVYQQAKAHKRGWTPREVKA